MGYRDTSFLSPENKDKRFQRLKARETSKETIAKVQRETNDAAAILLEFSNSTVDSTHPEDADDEEERSSKPGIHDPCFEVIMRLKQENKQLLQEVANLQEELRDTRQKLQGSRFSDSFLQEGNSDHKTQFLTGIPNHATFLWLISFCSSVLPLSMTLSPGSVLLMVFMKLRLNLVDQDLAYRFQVSRQTVNDIITKSLPVIAKKLSFLVHWPTKEEVIKNMPKVIRSTYKHCRVIIDCCEIFIDRPGNFTVRGMTWSNYKSHNTVKVLIAVSPVGGVSFVSRGFGGRVSDKVITQRSGFLQLLEHGDLVLADRGFLIADDLAARGAQLAIPAFTRGKAQLSPKEIETGRRLSRVRIHVERAIERVKNFRILSSTMRINLVPQFDNIMTICCAVANLHPKLVT